MEQQEQAVDSDIDTQREFRDSMIKESKNLRVTIDGLISLMRSLPRERGSAERTLAMRALQQAKHWLGEDLHILGAQYPYPNSMDPRNTIVDPQADTAQN